MTWIVEPNMPFLASAVMHVYLWTLFRSYKKFNHVTYVQIEKQRSVFYFLHGTVFKGI